MARELIAIYHRLTWFIGLPNICLLKARSGWKSGEKKMEGGRLDEGWCGESER